MHWSQPDLSTDSHAEHTTPPQSSLLSINTLSQLTSDLDQLAISADIDKDLGVRSNGSQVLDTSAGAWSLCLEMSRLRQEMDDFAMASQKQQLELANTKACLEEIQFMKECIVDQQKELDELRLQVGVLSELVDLGNPVRTTYWYVQMHAPEGSIDEPWGEELRELKRLDNEILMTDRVGAKLGDVSKTVWPERRAQLSRERMSLYMKVSKAKLGRRSKVERKRASSGRKAARAIGKENLYMSRPVDDASLT